MGTQTYESSHQPIRPDRYYIWTWVPKEYQGRSKRYFYPKHLTGVPYYSMDHIRITLRMYYRAGVLNSIHIISGKELLEDGNYHLEYNLNKASSRFWYKGKLRKAYKFYYAPEYRYNKYEKHIYIRKLTQIYNDYGKKAFDREYRFSLIGQREGLPPSYRRKKRREIGALILPNLPSLIGKGEEEVRKILMQKYPYLRKYSPLVEDQMLPDGD